MNTNQDTLKPLHIIALIFIAYTFSVLVRTIWVYQMGGNPELIWNDQLMINTNDGYYLAASIQKELMDMHSFNPRVIDAFTTASTALTTLLTKYSPFSLETVILYIPAFVASLVVIPLILIAKLYGNALWGFLAALLGSIAWSYYNRTMIGYFDTDMFSAMASMFILYFLLKTTEERTLNNALFASIAVLLYPYLYDQGLSLIYATGLVYMGYMLVVAKKEEFSYQSSILIAVALFGMPIWLKLALIISLFYLFKKIKLELKYLMLLAAIALFVFLYSGNVFALVWAKISVYLFRGSDTEGLHFYQVAQTVREAGQIEFSTMANRIIGSSVGVILALVGYVYLLKRKPAFVLALPLIGIGIFSLVGGLRFTVYAVPVAALSLTYLLMHAKNYFDTFSSRLISAGILYFGALIILLVSLGTGFGSREFSWELFQTYWSEVYYSQLKYMLIIGLVLWLSFLLMHLKDVKYKEHAYSVLLIFLFIYPNISHIVFYKVPTVFQKHEVEILDKLKSMGSDKDYIITWWDYGYPLWFYTGKNTLIDGGKHNHDNYLVSKILTTSSQKEAALLSRLSVETYVNSDYKTIADTLFHNKEASQVNVNDFFDELNTGLIDIPKPSREIFLYLPQRMINILPTVKVFSDIDLNTGAKKQRAFFYEASAVSQDKEYINFGSGVVFNQQTGMIRIGDQEGAINKVVTTALGPNNRVKVKVQAIHTTGSFVIMMLQNYNKVYIMDVETFNSTYVQMFYLENYDSTVFEPVILSPLAKIYRLKI